MKGNFQDIIAGEVPVLVDFYADWCAPCRAQAPILKQVKDQLGEGVKIVKVDVDKNPALATKFQIRSIPALLIFRDGQLAWRHQGVALKSELIEQLI